MVRLINCWRGLGSLLGEAGGETETDQESERWQVSWRNTEATQPLQGVAMSTPSAGVS